MKKLRSRERGDLLEAIYSVRSVMETRTEFSRQQTSALSEPCTWARVVSPK